MQRFENTSVLITGAASGIGRASALRLMREGAYIVALDVDTSALTSLREELGERGTTRVQDVCDADGWSDCADCFQSEGRRLDGLVNAAGITGFARGHAQQEAASVEHETLNAVMRVNFEGTVLGCQFAVRLMRERDPVLAPGTIVKLASRSGIVGIPMAAAYAASKAAVISYTKSLALLCAGKDWPIRCNSLSPAAIDTPMWNPVLGTGPEREANARAFIADCPLKRFGTADEAAAAVAFLASSDASYLTGTDMPLDGGILAGSAATPE